jgi:hypothetical protein
MGETAISVESLATEYLRLCDEGWNPNIEEFLSRVPDEMRKGCRDRIAELAALNGVDLEQAPAEADSGLSQVITPDGEDASASALEMRRGRRRAPPPEPLPEEEPSSVHEGIEALAAEPVETFELEQEPEQDPEPQPEASEEIVEDEAPQPEFEFGEHTETELLEVSREVPVEAPEPRSPRAPRGSRDEPSYAMPAAKREAVAPVRPKAVPRVTTPATTAAVSEEALRDVLSRVREVSNLERQGAIPPVESDRLHVIYRRLLDRNGASEDLPVTLPHLALYAFVAAAVSGASLFVALVHDAAPALQALVPGAIFVTLLGAGLRARAQGDGTGSSLFFAAGAVAAVPAIIAGLAIAGLLGGSGALPAPLSDFRVLAGSTGGLALAGLGLLFLRRGLLAWVTAALAAATYGSLVLVLGVKDLAPHEIALRFLPLVLLVVPGLLFESQGKVRWAMPFHLVSLAALVGSLDMMAAKGGLLDLVGLGAVAGPARVPYLGFAAAGLMLAILSLLLEHARSFDLRRGARFLQILAAIHLVVGLGWSAAVNGAGRDVLALGGASGLLLLLGRFHRGPLLVAGGLGFVLALGLAVTGGAMAPASFALALSGAGLLGSLGIYFYLGRRSA